MAEQAPSMVTPIGLDRDSFMRRLIASLGHLNEGVLGSTVTGAYIMNVGLSMGAAIEAEYKRFWQIDRAFTVDEYAHVIVDLKQKIHGNFSLVSKSPEKVVVQTTSCPFDTLVRHSPSLCFMTSSVFGGIAARNFGYAKVILHQRIALGDPICHVTVHLQRTPEALAEVGREYFPDVDQASPDIAEQLRLMDSVRRLHRQLSETTSRFDELLRSAADAIAVVDSAYRVAFANDRWRELLGIEGSELYGNALLAVIDSPERVQAATLLDGVLRGERCTGATFRLRHRNGSWRDVRLSAGPVRDDAGTIVGGVCIVRDVTEEQSLHRLREDFLAAASHEMRTPVTTIRGISQLLLRQLESAPEIDRATLTARLNTILREVDRLVLLSHDVVDAARLDQSMLARNRRPCDLAEIAATCVVRQQERLGPDVPLRFTTELLPAPVEADRPRLEQLLMSLLDNAVKYSPQGGEVGVRMSVEAQLVRVSVRDQGIGISAADLPRLFTPFFRGSNVSGHRYSGLGVGLYLSQAIAWAHGGALSVQSTEHAGSTFTLTLPLLV